MKKTILLMTLLLSFTAMAQDISFGAKERWLAQHGGFTCTSANTAANGSPVDFKNRAILFSYMTTDYTLDNGKFVASYHSKGTECRYNLIGLADNANFIFTKTASTAYAVNGGLEDNCVEGKEYLDSLFNSPINYFYYHGAMSLQVAVSDAATLCGEGATHVGIYFKKSAKTKID